MEVPLIWRYLLFEDNHFTDIASIWPLSGDSLHLELTLACLEFALVCLEQAFYLKRACVLR